MNEETVTRHPGTPVPPVPRKPRPDLARLAPPHGKKSVSGHRESLDRIEDATQTFRAELDELTERRAAVLLTTTPDQLEVIDRKVALLRRDLNWMAEVRERLEAELPAMEEAAADVIAADEAKAADLRDRKLAWLARDAAAAWWPRDADPAEILVLYAAHLNEGWEIRVAEEVFRRARDRRWGATRDYAPPLDTGPHLPATVTHTVLPAADGHRGRALYDKRVSVDIPGVPPGYTVFAR